MRSQPNVLRLSGLVVVVFVFVIFVILDVNLLTWGSY